MKLLLLLCALLLACSMAHAEGLKFPESMWGKDWTREDTYRQGVLTALLIVDWGQTLYIAKHPETYREVGTAKSFIGEHPSVGKVNSYFVFGIAFSAAVSILLPPDWRKGWQYIYIGYEFSYVQNNRSIGIKMDF